MTRYLIHNIYGDADDLIATAPNDVECLPRLWDEEGEENLIQRLVELGISSVSCLPALLYWREEQLILMSDGSEEITPAQWVELRIADIPTPWTWTSIDDALSRLS